MNRILINLICTFLIFNYLVERDLFAEQSNKEEIIPEVLALADKSLLPNRKSLPDSSNAFVKRQAIAKKYGNLTNDLMANYTPAD